MEIKVFESRAADGAQAGMDLTRQLATCPTSPDFAAVHFNAAYPAAALQAALNTAGIPAVHGASSCLGTMTRNGAQTDGAPGAALLAIWDPSGDYGTGMSDSDGDATFAAAQATEKALAAAGRTGEAPNLVWLACTPGHEEQVLAGIASIIGPEVPVLGGSAADNDISGHWTVMDKQATSTDGVVVSVLFPSASVALAYTMAMPRPGKAGSSPGRMAAI